MTAPTADGPTSTAKVAAMLSLADEEETAAAVAAVNSLIRGWLSPAPDGEWAPHHTYGATLLAARFYRRKDSPAGFQLQGMEAAAYVSRNDPDVAQLLGLGSYAPPRVG
jgi:hypothetical protein